MKLKTGDKLPSFVLKDDSGTSVTSDMLLGSNSILIFSKDNGSHAYLKELWDLRDEFLSLKEKFQIVYVICDGDYKSLGKIRTDNKLNFSLLSDKKKIFISACGFNGLLSGVKNGVLVIDQDLKIINSFEFSHPDKVVEGLIKFISKS